MFTPTVSSSDAQRSTLELLKLLADDTRWQLLGALRQSDRQVGELVRHLDLPQNLVSYHLGLLRQAGFVYIHRSEADARALYYALDLKLLQAAYQQIGADLYLLPTETVSIPQPTVVFLCTANSARSQIAEGWLRQLSNGRVPTRSAGTHPKVLHPIVPQVMAEVGIDIGYQQAKGLDALTDVTPDVVITVCDRAREECAPTFGRMTHIHWSIADPVQVEGEYGAQLEAFRAVREQLRLRVEALLPLLPRLSSTFHKA